jgi:structural maintenance of chromosome 2
MNKIMPHMPTKETLDYVAQVTQGKAVHAATLVKAALQLERTIQFVFGEAFVCEDNETARKLAFDPRVNMQCVTLEGDVYSP